MSKSKTKDNSFKIRWKSAKEKKNIISSIEVTKGELSINEWIKDLILKELRKNLSKNDVHSINDKLDKLLTINKNSNMLSKVTEAKLRTLFWFVINKLDINLEKGFKQLDLGGSHAIHKEILKSIK